MIELELTPDQTKAIRSLERAFKKCAEAKLYIHNCYGNLIAYDAEVVFNVDDVETMIPCTAGTDINTPNELDLASWADDAHYVHLHDE